VREWIGNTLYVAKQWLLKVCFSFVHHPDVGHFNWLVSTLYFTKDLQFMLSKLCDAKKDRNGPPNANKGFLEPCPDTAKWT